MTNIKICGVPEHFNYPWQICIENNEFEASNLEVTWTNVPEGTGKMCQMLRDGSTDIAIILTEGIIKDIAVGNRSKIVQMFVKSPLIWGIHVDSNSDYKKIADLETKKVAISRLGSGSHLMALVHASQMNWQPESLHFEITNNIDGAVKALTTKQADYFMWEKLMTKPLVDSGIFRRIGECPTPWPSFVIAVSDAFLKQNRFAVKALLQIINKETRNLKSVPNVAARIASFYNLETADVNEWLLKTNWSQNQFTEEMLNKVQNKLSDLKLIDKKVTFATAVTTL